MGILITFAVLLIISNFGVYILLRRDFADREIQTKQAYEQQKQFAVEIYESQITKLQADNHDLRSRFFVKNNLPPVGIDLAKEREQRMIEEKEKKNNKSTLPAGIGLVQQAQIEAMERDAKLNGGVIN